MFNLKITYAAVFTVAASLLSASAAAASVDYAGIEKVVDAVTDDYSWGWSEDTVVLQRILNVEEDGVYGSATYAAHVEMLETVGADTGVAPTPPPPPTPRPAEVVSKPPVSDSKPPKEPAADTQPPAATPPPAAPEPSNKLCGQWWGLARSAGWPQGWLPTLDQIMFKESRCAPSAVSPTGDYGLLQINWAAHGGWLTAAGITRDDLLDPYVNLVQGKRIADYAAQHYGCWAQPWYMSGAWC